MVVLALGSLLAGVYLSRSAPAPSVVETSKRSYVSTSPSEIRMPGVWLGKRFHGAIPVVSLAVLPGGNLNGLNYLLVYPTRSIVAIEPLMGKLPSGWRSVSTPVGEALLSPDNRYAVVTDPQGNKLKLQSYVGQAREVLSYLKIRPGAN